MTANIILIIFCCLMIWAAISDVRYFILSNRLCISVALLYPIFLAALYLDGFQVTLESIGWSIGISILIFSFLVFLFARGYIGGGDVKLIPAIALWAGPSRILEFILITTICGGLLALLIISFRYLKNYISLHKSSEKINFSMSESAESDHEENNIPYGVGISIGGLYIAYQLFQALN
ncbi:MAG: prepilin peptidase [Alphaproteobacteria bacterium]|nr:prepilin peptidase [Alphaproteobacteria bacterium]HPF46292.1 prepilin peptidase [Emcibacteraceae bacterium]